MGGWIIIKKVKLHMTLASSKISRTDRPLIIAIIFIPEPHRGQTSGSESAFLL